MFLFYFASAILPSKLMVFFPFSLTSLIAKTRDDHEGRKENGECFSVVILSRSKKERRVASLHTQKNIEKEDCWKKPSKASPPTHVDTDEIRIRRRYGKQPSEHN